MHFLMMAVIILICLAMIFKGAQDASEFREDQEKFGGDTLIKAISEFNEKSGSMKGHIGAVGVTRTPLIENTRGNNAAGTRNLPRYNRSIPLRPQQNYYTVDPNENPYDPYRRTNNNPSTPSSDQDQDATGGEGRGDYYPPPPVIQQPRSELEMLQQRQKNYVVPMNLPPQQWPTEMMQLRTGQDIRFAGTHVYTFDREGSPIQMPDGEYYLGKTNYKITIQDGKKTLTK